MSTLVPVTFRFPGSLAPGVSQVAVVGPFNGWNSTAHRLTKSVEDEWAITIYLPPGRIVYCFYVDGTRRLDPHDDGRLCAGEGLEYSVRYIRLDAGGPLMWSTPHVSAH